MTMDQSKLGQVVAEQMEAIEEDHGEECEIGDVCVIVEVVCRDTAHFTELLTQRVHHVDGVVAAESFLVLEIHKMAYGWGVGQVATASEEHGA